MEKINKTGNRLLKRALDLAVALPALAGIAVVLPIIAYKIKRQSPGPVFFSQLRTGRDGREFRCYKFRSMHVNDDADTLQATEDDPRKFPFGAFMRRHNIDELPQFWNVLLGDMSVVGPRPHMLYHTDYYSGLIDTYMLRHAVKPGVTGWAQSTGYCGETKDLADMEERVRRDLWYIDHWSLSLDLKIIWATAHGVLSRDIVSY